MVEMAEEEWQSTQLELTKKMAAERVNKMIKEGISKEYWPNIKNNVLGARKAKHIIDELGIYNIGKISMDTIRNAS